MLTTEEITEMLMHHDELLEMYRMQINELTKEWEGNTEVEKDEGRMKICVTFAEKN